MRSIYKILVLSLIALFVSSCSPTDLQNGVVEEKPAITSRPLLPTETASLHTGESPTPSPTGIDEARPTQPTPVPTSEPISSPTPTPETNLRTQYTFLVGFNYSQHFVRVDQTVLFTNGSGEPIDEFIFAVDANRYPNTFWLKNVSLGDSTTPPSYRLESHLLTVSLSNPLEPGKSEIINIEYELTLPEIPQPDDTSRPVTFGYSTRQTNLVDWYPYLPPYVPGAGWQANRPWFFGEHQVYESSDFAVQIEIINPPTNLTLAASSLPDVEENIYQYQHTNARNFVISASQMYQVFETQVGDVTVLSYAFPFDTVGGKVALEETARALALYNDLFGPYPHSSLSVVEADFYDGMEFDGLYFLSRGFYASYDGTPKGYLTMIAVHETAHQWWYGLVGNDQAHEPWLDEALCTYSELLYYEHYHPDLVDWWWDYRVNFYEPRGFIDGSIYSYNGFWPYRDATYLQGARFLHELRQTIGDEAFFSFLKTFTERNAHSIATGAVFFDVLREVTDQDLDLLISTYFENQ
jgi:hypothetical protein